MDGSEASFRWDGKINLGIVIAAMNLISIIGGGIYALAQMNAQIEGVRSDLGELKTEVRAQLAGEAQALYRQERRIDDLNNRVFK